MKKYLRDFCSATKKPVKKSGCSAQTLIGKVKNLKISCAEDVQQTIRLNDSIYYEWNELRKKHRKKIKRNIKMRIDLFWEYEAEEELLVGLMGLINEKLVQHIIKEGS